VFDKSNGLGLLYIGCLLRREHGNDPSSSPKYHKGIPCLLQALAKRVDKIKEKNITRG